ncbi:hypothetical protein [Rhizobium sp. LjRoot258]|uniref:hypothetical protein n=1 Tax=Rhizobium sp. LjRoot258 TaxID=3342299 RepID=UPI003ECE7992
MVDLTGQTISAIFDHERDAEHAANEVIASGIANDAVTITRGHGTDTLPKDHGGFLDAVEKFFFTQEQRNVYAEALRRGGFLVSVQVKDQAQHDAVLKILADKGSIDIDERAEQWRAQGWQ